MENDAYTNENAGDEGRIVDLLAGLPRAAAPADFDIRVRARIANGKPHAKVGFRLPAAVAYGIGLGVVLVAFGLFGIVWMYSGQADGVPAVAAVDHSNQAENPRNVVIPNDSPTSSSNNTVASSRTPIPPVTERSPAIEDKPGVRAARTPEIKPDSARKKARTIYPEGIDPSLNASPITNAAERGKPIQVKELLSFLGVGASFADGGWRVDSISANSTAGRVGLKAGDVITAINDQAINENTSFAGSFTGKSLQIRRDGQKINVDLAKK
jgi:hypothetical protein